MPVYLFTYDDEGLEPLIERAAVSWRLAFESAFRLN
jgi:hypothetical protein